LPDPQVSAEGRNYGARFMKRFNNSNGPFRAIEMKAMIRDLRISETPGLAQRLPGTLQAC
jgi:hypothetical protein